MLDMEKQQAPLLMSMPSVMAVLAGQDGVADAAQLVAAGASRAQQSRMVRLGELVRVRRDTLVLASSLKDTTSWERRAVITRAVGLSLASAAAAPKSPPAHALSHQSALIIHDLPYFGDDGGPVHLCRTDGARGRRDRAVFVHKPIDDEWVEVVNGFRVVVLRWRRCRWPRTAGWRPVSSASTVS